ncbi:MAG: BrnT family toxin [Chloracidobacterium sp.]|nr:BrnT family toxin [Chloracidobacterium sp.]
MSRAPRARRNFCPNEVKRRWDRRFLIIGQSYRGRLLVVSFAERADDVRMISARKLTRAERKAYEEERQRWNAG